MVIAELFEKLKEKLTSLKRVEAQRSHSYLESAGQGMINYYTDKIRDLMQAYPEKISKQELASEVSAIQAKEQIFFQQSLIESEWNLFDVIIEMDGLDVNITFYHDNAFITPLDYMVGSKHLDIERISKLIQKGAILSRDNIEAILYNAINKNRIEVIAFLFNKIENPNSRKELIESTQARLGYTDLMMAVLLHETEAFKVLVAQKNQDELLKKNVGTALALACKLGSEEKVDILLGSSIVYTNNKLMMAMEKLSESKESSELIAMKVLERLFKKSLKPQAIAEIIKELNERFKLGIYSAPVKIAFDSFCEKESIKEAITKTSLIEVLYVYKRRRAKSPDEYLHLWQGFFGGFPKTMKFNTVENMIAILNNEELPHPEIKTEQMLKILQQGRLNKDIKAWEALQTKDIKLASYLPEDEQIQPNHEASPKNFES